MHFDFELLYIIQNFHDKVLEYLQFLKSLMIIFLSSFLIKHF